ncbi:hypothetical protein JMUB6875_40550 [Nocardia sp. JMUB6875]|uniref:hypothetical protein n=1 Tax=Nocardia sp. JMUB6875 TaxID=3158170 RepID=UPI0032E6A6F1
MRIRTLMMAAATAAATMLTVQATAYADTPVPNDTTLADAPTLHVDAKIVGQAVELHTGLGTLRVADRHLQIVDPKGVVVGAIPLTLVKGDTAYPVDAHIDGNDATLTPATDRTRLLTDDERRLLSPAAAAIAGGDSPEDRMNDAMANANTELGLAVSVGTLLGAIIGGPLGCVFAGALGTFIATPGIGTVAGCLLGAVAGAGIGVVAFNLLIGVPALIASGIHAYNVMTAPPAEDN